jgi:uncharacterized membrane protein
MTSLLIHIVLPIHIVAGGVGLVSGAAALFAAKGARLHRKSGMLFVCAMVALALTGGGMAALQGDELTACVGLLTAYLVTTALVTVRPPAAGALWLNLGAMLVSLAVGLTCVAFGLDALASPGGEREFPPAPYFIFGSVALLGGVSDLRMIRTGGFRGARRLARHLWRMCVALLIAAISFFGGQADSIPEALRIPALLALPAPTVLLMMFYYLWRVRIRRTYRGNLGAGSDGET